MSAWALLRNWVKCAWVPVLLPSVNKRTGPILDDSFALASSSAPFASRIDTTGSVGALECLCLYEPGQQEDQQEEEGADGQPGSPLAALPAAAAIRFFRSRFLQLVPAHVRPHRLRCGGCGPRSVFLLVPEIENQPTATPILSISATGTTSTA